LISRNIAKRYARAFFKIAGQEQRYEQFHRELVRFSSLLEKNRHLFEFLANPVFAQPDKRAVVDALLEKLALSPLTANFLRLLVDKRRIGILSHIEGCYRELVDDALQKAAVTVKTAFPLSDMLSARLRQEMETLTGRKVEMTIVEDPSLLGGIVVKVGDRLYDGSIRTQLVNMRNLLGEEG
jgi:F-type H+-transporting ATPase subunit delta